MVKTNDLTDGSRRRFLGGGLAGIGASDTLLRWIDRDELQRMTDDPTDEIPIVTHVRHINHDAFVASIGSDEPTKLEREPVYKRVPYDRWAYIEAVEDAAAQLRRRFRGQRLIQIGVESRTNGQHRERAVTVTHTTYRDANGTEHAPSVPARRIREEIPAAVTGRAGTETKGRAIEDVPVVFDEAVVEAQAYYDYEYRPVPAGARQEIKSGAISTVGTPRHRRRERVLGHVRALHRLGSDQHVPERRHRGRRLVR